MSISLSQWNQLISVCRTEVQESISQSNHFAILQELKTKRALAFGYQDSVAAHLAILFHYSQFGGLLGSETQDQVDSLVRLVVSHRAHWADEAIPFVVDEIEDLLTAISEKSGLNLSTQITTLHEFRLGDNPSIQSSRDDFWGTINLLSFRLVGLSSLQAKDISRWSALLSGAGLTSLSIRSHANENLIWGHADSDGSDTNLVVELDGLRITAGIGKSQLRREREQAIRVLLKRILGLWLGYTSSMDAPPEGESQETIEEGE